MPPNLLSDPVTITITNRSDSNGDELAINAIAAKTVLETLEQNNIDIQFHCRDGFCGACRCKLLKGDVSYTTDPLAFIDDDEFLPCCTKATTSLLIEID